MSEYRWVPDLVCHGMCPRDANLHALEVPGDRIIVFTAATCPHCRAEKAERERDEARKAHRAAITRQSDAEWQARGIAECLGWDGQGSAVSWLGSQIDAARAAVGGENE